MHPEHPRRVDASRASRWFWFLAAAVLALRALVAAQWPLTGDEAYHWEWSRNPAWGYYDHPPLHAWTMWAATAFGVSEFTVRLPSLLAGLAMALLARAGARAMARDLGADAGAAERAGLGAGALLLLMPIATGLGAYATGDALVALAWLAAVLLLGRMSARPQAVPLSWWIALGLVMGLGLQAKFLFAPFGILALGWVLADRERRRWLARPGPWLAGALAIVVVAPLLLWNADHGWATFAFNFAARQDDAWEFKPLEPPLFLASQILVASPVLAVAALVLAGRWAARRVALPPAAALVAVAILVILVPFLGRSLGQRPGIHWPAAAWIIAVPLLAAWWEARGSVRLRRWALAAAGGLTVPALLLLAVGPGWIDRLLPVAGEAPPTGRLADLARARAWPAWAEQAVSLRDELARARGDDKVLLLAPQYGHVATIAFYGPGRPVVRMWDGWLSHGQQYRWWDRWPEYAGHDAVWVTRRPGRITEALPLLRAHFREVDEPEMRPVEARGRVVDRMWIIRARGFDGRIPEWPGTSPLRTWDDE
ncbi:MAG: hypothetical protein RLZZ127_1722 [Planctomycetota bacterium]|jgi:4-amino-4-deoxy-L-arabinose transferase-like glycosyltransferase